MSQRHWQQRSHFEEAVRTARELLVAPSSTDTDRFDEWLGTHPNEVRVLLVRSLADCGSHFEILVERAVELPPRGTPVVDLAPAFTEVRHAVQGPLSSEPPSVPPTAFSNREFALRALEMAEKRPDLVIEVLTMADLTMSLGEWARRWQELKRSSDLEDVRVASRVRRGAQILPGELAKWPGKMGLYLEQILRHASSPATPMSRHHRGDERMALRNTARWAWHYVAPEHLAEAFREARRAFQADDAQASVNAMEGTSLVETAEMLLDLEEDSRGTDWLDEATGKEIARFLVTWLGATLEASPTQLLMRERTLAMTTSLLERLMARLPAVSASPDEISRLLRHGPQVSTLSPALLEEILPKLERAAQETAPSESEPDDRDRRGGKVAPEAR